MAAILGPLAATMTEAFKTGTRFSGVGISYNLAQAFFGGTAPLISTWLISQTGQKIMPAFYLMALALASFIGAWMLRKGARRSA